jgi:beta-lactamase superfamily II metal-dependent hydrolase
MLSSSSLTESSRGVAPGPSDFEVSIFGPGKGEALAVHLGGGDWITVDSCNDQVTREHPVLSYLSSIGVEPASQIRLVVGTHAHDDHIAGISELFAAASSATFIVSSAVTSPEFFATMEADADIEGQIRQTIRAEYRAVMEEVERRGRSNGLKPMKRALEQLTLWSREAVEDLPAARVLALSPSDEAVTRSLQLLAQGSAKASQRRRLSAGDPNEFAVALWIEVGNVYAVLGADLLKGPRGCGWQAVLATHNRNRRASLIKVPHHGSPNAHHAGLWSELLTDDVVSVLAPYRAGRTPRPSLEDVERICSLSMAAYSTASPKLPAQPDSVRRIRTALTGIATNVREPHGRAGHVRARWASGASQWDVETFEPARKLSAG